MRCFSAPAGTFRGVLHLVQVRTICRWAVAAAAGDEGAAAGLARLSTEQRTKITSIIRQHKVEPTKLTVSVSVGTRLPESVRLYPLPAQVIVVYPEWRGLEYILVGNQIAVIDPRTHEIVAILEA